MRRFRLYLMTLLAALFCVQAQADDDYDDAVAALQELITDATATYYATPCGIFDQESKYYTDGTECGEVAHISLLNALAEAINAGAQAIEDKADIETLTACYNAIADACDACYSPNNPIQDGGFYYIICGYADDTQKAGVPFAMSYDARQAQAERVYKRMLVEDDSAFIFQLTIEGDNYYLQNLKSGLYIAGLDEGVLVFSEEKSALSVEYVPETAPDTWTGGRNNTKQLIRYNIRQMGVDGYFQCKYNNSASTVTTIGTGGNWWQYGWMFRPVVFKNIGQAQKELVALINAIKECGYTTALADHTSPHYTDGTECGTVVTVELLAELNAALDSAQVVAFAEEIDDEAIAYWTERLTALNAECSKGNPFKPGYYYIISGYAGFSMEHAQAWCTDQDAAEGYVYLDKLNTISNRYVWQITEAEEEGLYYIQNVATKEYLDILDPTGITLLPEDQKADLSSRQIVEKTVENWNAAEQAIRYHIYNDADGDEGMYGSGTAPTILGTNPNWWMYGWILRPATPTNDSPAKGALRELYAQCLDLDVADAADDTESPYYSNGDEMGRVVSGEIWKQYRAVLNKVLDLLNDPEATDEACEAAMTELDEARLVVEENQENPLVPGYYYIVSGYADDSKNAKVPFAMSAITEGDLLDAEGEAATDRAGVELDINRVYKRALQVADRNFIFRLDTDGATWTMRNLGNGNYVGALDAQDYLNFDTGAAEQFIQETPAVDDAGNNLWGGEDDIKNRTRFNISSATDMESYYQCQSNGSDAASLTTIGSGTSWWMYGWKIRPAYGVDITVPASGLTTAVFPENVVIPEGVTVYAITGTNDDEQAIAMPIEAKVLAKGVPVLVKAEAGSYNFEFTKAEGVTPAKNLLSGQAWESTDVNYGETYTLYTDEETNETAFVMTDAAIVPLGEACLNVADGSGLFSITFVPAGVNSATAQAKAGQAYDLQGRPAAADAKGIIVKNGKKVAK